MDGLAANGQMFGEEVTSPARGLRAMTRAKIIKCIVVAAGVALAVFLSIRHFGWPIALCSRTQSCLALVGSWPKSCLEIGQEPEIKRACVCSHYSLGREHESGVHVKITAARRSRASSQRSQ
jgi:hypothetical protein